MKTLMTILSLLFPSNVSIDETKNKEVKATVTIVHEEVEIQYLLPSSVTE